MSSQARFFSLGTKSYQNNRHLPRFGISAANSPDLAQTWLSAASMQTPKGANSARGKVAVIIGAGPAGLTAAYELLTQTDIKPIVLEKTQRLGGISTTINYKGNRMDIGGHRFFSKSDRVMEWWLRMLPLQQVDRANQVIAYQNQVRAVNGCSHAPRPDASDQVMLIRPRKSRIYFQEKFFNYPLTLDGETILKLGPLKTLRIALSYFRSLLFPIKPERSLEDFFVNRFGQELYKTFFRSYTEKVWGIHCSEISAEWGAQRIKGLSIKEALCHYVKRLLKTKGDLRQKDTETSLIEQFMYPKYGPGQMWEQVAVKIRELGGEILIGYGAVRIYIEGNRAAGVEAISREKSTTEHLAADYVFSTMPVKELVRALDVNVPPAILEISDGLLYRDFITVGLLLNKITVADKGEAKNELISDNWIYIQEPNVRVGRIQIFNNWSPYLVADATKIWVGLEYFCNETDSLWWMTDADLVNLATEEMIQMGFIERSDVIDANVVRMPKTYPAYFGTYPRFEELRLFLDQFENLFLLGRNGMHKYNNQDHSMLTAMTAVGNIVEDRKDKANIWDVNTEEEYHESK
jgi:protoporphyrinogen oxidase